MYIYSVALEVIIITSWEDVALGGGRVLWKEYRSNLQETIKLFGRAITMTSWFGVTYVRYELVAQL